MAGLLSRRQATCGDQSEEQRRGASAPPIETADLTDFVSALDCERRTVACWRCVGGRPWESRKSRCRERCARRSDRRRRMARALGSGRATECGAHRRWRLSTRRGIGRPRRPRRGAGRPCCCRRAIRRRRDDQWPPPVRRETSGRVHPGAVDPGRRRRGLAGSRGSQSRRDARDDDGRFSAEVAAHFQSTLALHAVRGASFLGFEFDLRTDDEVVIDLDVAHSRPCGRQAG